MNNYFKLRPEFKAFAYTNQIFNKITNPVATKAEKIAQATSTVFIFPLAISIDLITVSFRAIKHINALETYKAEGFHLRELLGQNHEEVIYSYIVDLKQLEYKPAPFTNRLVKKLENFSYDSKIKKMALKVVTVITVQFTLVLDTLITPFHYYNFLKDSYSKVIAGGVINDMKEIERLKYKSTPLTDWLIVVQKKCQTNYRVANIALNKISEIASFFMSILDGLSDPFRFIFYLINHKEDLIRFAKRTISKNRKFLLFVVFPALIVFSIAARPRYQSPGLNFEVKFVPVDLSTLEKKMSILHQEEKVKTLSPIKKILGSDLFTIYFVVLSSSLYVSMSVCFDIIKLKLKKET